jgi:dihydroorotase
LFFHRHRSGAASATAKGSRVLRGRRVRRRGCLQTYVQVFDEESALDHFEAFASLNGAQFYGVEPNTGTVVLERRECRVMPAVPVGDDEVVVFRGGITLPWSLGLVTV